MNDITDLEGVFIGLNEFGTGYTLSRRIYDKLLELGFCDNSWGNDVSPHMSIVDDNDQQFMVWVDHKDPAKRERQGRRFYINIVGQAGTDDFKYMRETDEENEVLSFVKDGFLVWNKIKNTTPNNGNKPTSHKEEKMAKKKAQKKSAKKAVKKVAKKKPVKKAAKKVAKKTATRKTATRKPKEPSKTPLSRFVCKMLIDGVADEKIVEAMKRDYPDMDCSQKTVSWYRFAINQGRMEKVGFPCPEDGALKNPRRVASENKKAEKEAKRAAKSEKKETKKVARRKVARRKNK